MAAENSSESPPEEAKGAIGMIGLIILCVASLGSSFAGVYLFGGQSTAGVQACAPASAPTEWSAPLVDRNFAYVPLDELTISIGGGDASRFVKIQVSIITDPDEKKVVENAEIILLDAFSTYMRSVSPSDFEDPAFYPHMKRQLARRAEIILGSAGSHGILVTEFLLR